MEHAGMNATELERAALLTKGYMSRPLSGKREKVDPTILARIADKCGVNFEWLATGRGEMVRASAPEVHVVRDPASPVDVEDAQSPLEAALGEAFDSKRYTLRDVDAVRTALRETDRLEKVGVDLVEAARTWLDAAAGLRKEGTPVTLGALLVRVTVGKGALARRAAEKHDEEINADAAERARKMGLEPGSLAHMLQPVIDAEVAKRKRGGGEGD